MSAAFGATVLLLLTVAAVVAVVYAFVVPPMEPDPGYGMRRARWEFFRQLWRACCALLIVGVVAAACVVLVNVWLAYSEWVRSW